MSIVEQPVRLESSQIEIAGQVLGRAFHDDPMFLYILPDKQKRARVLPWFSSAATRAGHLYGEVYTTPGTVEGVAVWFRRTPSPMQWLRAGMLTAPFRLGFSEFGRFSSLSAHMEKLEKRDMPSDHWHLMVLGVDPTRQGQGVGSRLLQPVLAKADAEGIQCYLETMKSINVTFYQRHGFQVVVEDDAPKSGLHFWTMKREPQG